jgi:hypothetical protein
MPKEKEHLSVYVVNAGWNNGHQQQKMIVELGSMGMEKDKATPTSPD